MTAIVVWADSTATLILNRRNCLPLIRRHVLALLHHVIIKAYLSFMVESSHLLIIIYDRSDTSCIHFLDWLVCVFNNANMTFFIHKRLSALESFLEITIPRFFPHNVRNTRELIIMFYVSDIALAVEGIAPIIVAIHPVNRSHLRCVIILMHSFLR